MQVIKIDPLNLKLEQMNPIAACIGYFDGLHLGHQTLFNETFRIAKENNLSSALITFEPDPWMVLNDKIVAKHITPLKTKIQIAADMGFDCFLILKFTKEFSKYSPESFIDDILNKINLEYLVCGSDFKFAFKGQGNVSFLKKYENKKFKVHEILLNTLDSEKIGSTKITQLILNGEIEQANKMLGRTYEISGEVIHGKKQGRKIGFPTANMELSSELIIPKTGIYAGYTYINGEKYQSVLNIGYNPTFNTNDYLSVEVFILDFDGDLYGQNLKQTFCYRLRDELKFNNVDSLIDQMNQDVLNARILLKG